MTDGSVHGAIVVPVPGGAVGEAVAPEVATEEASEAAIQRRRVRTHRMLLNAVGLVVILLAAFPVYWMINTSFRTNLDIRSDPEFLPLRGTLANYRTVFERDFFWTAFRNSIMVTLLTVGLALFTAFLAALAISRFR
ncbi:MAG: carbohydrate ABC transporter permease, partial [Candidatus Limnocylindrales bacterium]